MFIYIDTWVVGRQIIDRQVLTVILQRLFLVFSYLEINGKLKITQWSNFNPSFSYFKSVLKNILKKDLTRLLYVMFTKEKVTVMSNNELLSTRRLRRFLYKEYKVYEIRISKYTLILLSFTSTTQSISLCVSVELCTLRFPLGCPEIQNPN